MFTEEEGPSQLEIIALGEREKEIVPASQVDRP
jgi:hypothetical protein